VNKLVGHAEAVRQVLAGLQADATAFLITGERGVGKTTLTQHVIAAQYGSLDHVDVLECPSEGASFGVKPMRELLDRVLDNLPATDFKTAVLYDAERFTVPAADALLKTLEEGTAKTRFILTAVDPMRVRPTIRSRCELVQLTRLTDGEVKQVLEGNRISVDPDYIRLARGLPGRAVRAALGSLEAVHTQAKAVIRDLYSVPLWHINSLIEVVSDELLRDLIEEMMVVLVEATCSSSSDLDPYKGHAWVLMDELAELYRVSSSAFKLRRHLVVALTSTRLRIRELLKEAA
jgi:DNA polymerase-3 subunit delta'